jgi:hypothetical protein
VVTEVVAGGDRANRAPTVGGGVWSTGGGGGMMQAAHRFFRSADISSASGLAGW